MAARDRIQKLIQRLEQGIKNQPAVLEQIVRETEKEILDLNRQQLFKGADADGGSLGQYKSTWYAKFKAMLNPNKVVDLFLTGSFYNKMFIRKVKLPDIEIDSKDSKRNELVDKYGNIFGLNSESKKIYVKKILKVRLTKYWRELLRIR